MSQPLLASDETRADGRHEGNIFEAGRPVVQLNARPLRVVASYEPQDPAFRQEIAVRDLYFDAVRSEALAQGRKLDWARHFKTDPANVVLVAGLEGDAPSVVVDPQALDPLRRSWSLHRAEKVARPLFPSLDIADVQTNIAKTYDRHVFL